MRFTLQWVNLYGILAACTVIVTLYRSLLYYSTALTAASGLHHKALARVLLAPMAFFTSNPIGRIVNRFSSDQVTCVDLSSALMFVCFGF